MCSISGVIEIGSEQLGSEALNCCVKRMNAALRHRGPDDQGIVSPQTTIPNVNVCLGNTRLSIIDTSTAGHQPMQDPDSGNWITYNGETYNYRQLRNEIGDEFGPWRSNSDTEVVLRAYRKWGVQAFERLRGMFSVALWDERQQQLVLARDTFGIKPLYYYIGKRYRDEDNKPLLAPGSPQTIQAKLFLFASEVRALLASGVVERRLSANAVKSFLEYGSVQTPLTIIDNVWSIMPGTCVTVSASREGRLSFTVHDFRTATLPPQTIRHHSHSEARLELRRLLEDSVKQHLVSDVPLGLFLSGGIDSSTLVALASKVGDARPQTFSVVFDEQKFSEAPFAQAVAERFKTKHHEIRLTEERLLKALPTALQSLDQPSMDGINTFVVSGAVKNEGVTVALSGLGGDELFAGYPSFRRAVRFANTNRLTRRALRPLSYASKAFGKGSTRREKLQQLALHNNPQDVYRISRQLFSPHSIEELSRCQVSGNGFHFSAKDGAETDIVNQVSRLELEGYMANTLLRDTDSMSMAHSLEVRVPFLDNEVAAFVLSLPGDWKFGPTLSNASKPLLADTMADLLPDDLRTRQKMGFTLPFERWLGSQLKADVGAVLYDESGLSSAGLTHKPTRQIWERFLKHPGAVGWSRPWALYVLAKWCQLNNVSAGAQ